MMTSFKNPRPLVESPYARKLVRLAPIAFGEAGAMLKSHAPLSIDTTKREGLVPFKYSCADWKDEFAVRYRGSGSWVGTTNLVSIFAFRDGTAILMQDSERGPCFLPVALQLATKATTKRGKQRFSIAVESLGNDAAPEVVLKTSNTAKRRVALSGPTRPDLPKFDSQVRGQLLQTILAEADHLAKSVLSTLDRAKASGPIYPPFMFRFRRADRATVLAAQQELRLIGVTLLSTGITQPNLYLKLHPKAVYQDGRASTATITTYNAHLATTPGLGIAVDQVLQDFTKTENFQEAFLLSEPGEGLLRASCGFIGTRISTEPTSHEVVEAAALRPEAYSAIRSAIANLSAAS